MWGQIGSRTPSGIGLRSDGPLDRMRLRSVLSRELGIENFGILCYRDDGATLDDLREAVTTLEDAARVVRRVLGGANPLTEGIEEELRDARNARKTALADVLADMRVAGFGILMCHEKLNLQAR